MADKYRAADSESIAAGATETILMITAPADSRPRILGLAVSCLDYTSADGAMTIKLQKATTTGTSSALTPIPTDEAAPATDVVAAKDFTVEPTLTTEYFKRIIPMQALGEWQFTEDEQIMVVSGRVAVVVTNPTGGARTFQAELLFRD